MMNHVIEHPSAQHLFARTVDDDLIELPCGVFPGPRGLGACVFCACVGGGGALVCGLGGLPVLLCQLARLVPVGLGCADEGLSIGAHLAGQLLGLALTLAPFAFAYWTPVVLPITCGILTV